MGHLMLVLAILSQWGGDSILNIDVNASLSGALAYNYVDPYLYLINYSYENPGSASGMRGAFVNPAALASVKSASASFSAGFGRVGGINLNLSSNLPYVGEVGLPVTLYAEEKSGIYMGGAAVRIGEVVLGLAYVQGDRFESEIDARGELNFTATYSYRDTLTELDFPDVDEPMTVPVLIDLYGKGGGIISVENRTKLKSTPVLLMLATQDKGINYGISFRLNTFNGFIDYTDTLTPVLKPTGANVYSESDIWDVGVQLIAQIEGGELYANRYFTTLTGNELGAVFGIQKQGQEFSWGASLEQDLGAQILEVRNGKGVRGGLPRIVEINTQNLEVDQDSRIIKGQMKVVFGYDSLREIEGESRTLLTLPPRTSIRGGIQATPGDWIIDATLAMAGTWGEGNTEAFFGTGFGYNWKVPIRFSQAVFYRVTKIEEVPIYTIPALFFGVSTTLAWKGIELDLSVRANTTTALFGNYAAAIDPSVPNLGILNHISAGAALTYGF